MIRMGKGHAVPIPFLSTPAKTLSIDDASARSTTAFIFIHGSPHVLCSLAIGSSVVGNEDVVKLHLRDSKKTVLGFSTPHSDAPHFE
jgi:hypothetical protein